MLKPQRCLLLKKCSRFVIVLATLSTPVIKSMGPLLATNSPIGHPKPIIWLLLTLFLSFFPKEQDVKGIQLTSQQCQILTNISHKQNLEDPTSHTQINQVGTFSADEIPNLEQSSTSKFLSSLSAIKESWIIDSGATDQVCHNLNFFTTYTKIKLVLISLPNGQTVYATYSGLVRFFDKFYLSNVLYVPYFQLNLIFVSKLTHQLKCTLNFTSTHCIIQDNLTQEGIGIVKATVGLYLVTVGDGWNSSLPCVGVFDVVFS